MWALYHSQADLLILLGAVGVSIAIALLPARWRRVETLLVERIGAMPYRFCLLIGLVALLGSAIVSLGWKFPQPGAHDEFSYLLAADTYSSGRLANPPHPLGIHFESFHILQRPTYASRYPPAQGLFLAAGKVLGGHPVVGVWLSAALGCAAICWMLSAWLPPAWAIFGALLVLLRLGICGYWSQGYWGGWVAAIGGALLLGGLRRTIEQPRVRDSLLLALGLALLANSRPFEGLVLAIPCAVVLLTFLVRRIRRGQPGSLLRVVLPITLVLLANFLWIGFFNRAVTGDPLKFPHQVYIDTYMSAPYFLFLSPGPPAKIRHREMATLHNKWELELYERQQVLSGWLTEKKLMVKLSWQFFLGVALSLPLLLLFLSRRDPWVLFAISIWVLYLAINLIVMSPTLPHYPAPLVPLLYFLVAQAVYAAWKSARWHRVGALLLRALPLAGVATLVYSLVAPYDFTVSPHPNWNYERARIFAELEASGERHLIIVRYNRGRPQHYIHEEWVFNEADIDAAPVIWAREMSAGKNRKLLRKFKKRQAWLLEADTDEPRLVPYPRPGP